MSSAFEGLPKTPNLKLNKPGYDNVADIEALNENADILDEEIQGIKNTFVKSVNGINAGDGGNVDLGIIPISQGGTGQTTASGVRKALGLGNTTGALPIENGGTGATTAKNAINDFINALDLGNSSPVDDDYFISQYVGGGDTNKSYYRRKMSYLWDYIKPKLNAVTSIPANSDLDNYKTAGIYSCWLSDNAQSLSNNPMSTLSTGIILEVIVDGTAILQKIYGTSVRGMYVRRYNNGWNSWKNINNGIKSYKNVTNGYIVFENNIVFAWATKTIPNSNTVITKPISFKTLAVLSGDRGDSNSIPATQAMVRYDLTTNTSDTFLGANGKSDVQYIMWIGYKES